MSRKEPLLLEIGCEEIPALVIAQASRELGRRVLKILDQARLEHGSMEVWGGPRRLAVYVAGVEARQEDREETVLGPPVKVAFDEARRPTRAALGFAKKQRIDPERLIEIETDRGAYAGFKRTVAGQEVGELLAQEFPAAVESMSFPRTMRWADGRYRWVRPVHWLLALHGKKVLPIELFGVSATQQSVGHRFLGVRPVAVRHPDRYRAALESARVLVDPVERRRRIRTALQTSAEALKGCLVEDPALLDEVADMVEWPGVISGSFAEAYLDLPREILVTTLRHHQKCFSVQADNGDPLPVFLAVANTDQDGAGNIRRGNEWVVGGRLEDARFFWREDRKRKLADRSAELERVVFQAKAGSFADKAERIARLAGAIAKLVGLNRTAVDCCRKAASVAKNDLVTGTVGEFPELQGQVGGLLLIAENEPEQLAKAVYEHYQPSGPEDPIPPTVEGCVVSVADKLDTVSELIGAGEKPSGSRDPYGLRRGGAGIVRIVFEQNWKVSLEDLYSSVEASVDVANFLGDRLFRYLLDRGYSSNEYWAVAGSRTGERINSWRVPDIVARLEAIKRVRGREDFRNLVKLTQRVDNILTKDGEKYLEIQASIATVKESPKPKAAESVLDEMVLRHTKDMERKSTCGQYAEIVDILSEFIDPVESFFDQVLVLDPSDPKGTHDRWELLAGLKGLLTRYFDIRELAGQAERRVE